ncbi:MAG TPA: DUF1127 domain-containing protein [Geminicoccaceae bacterium]|nr:DUF1127 domain-containing protein [Geminicoccaceae bacterium]
MRAQMQVQSERLARGPADEQWARIDPIVYLAEGRRRQAQAMAAAIGAGWRALRWGLSGLAALAQRQLLEPLARRSERKRAIGRLAELDDRLLADIGLRRSDIALAVDGLLADPRVTRRSPDAAATERLLEGERCPVPAGSANSNRPAAPARPDRVPDLAA